MKHFDPRFAGLETKAEGDTPEGLDAVTAALDGLKADMTAERKAFGSRLDGFEARLNRPAAGLETKAASIEARAFDAYLHRGLEGMDGTERKALAVGAPGDGGGPNGGYLATPEFGAELLKLIVQFSPVRSYAKKVTLNGPSLAYPRRLTSVAASWTAEAAPRTPSAPTFERQTITPYSLTAEAIVSDELLEDNAYDLQGELLAEFAEQMGVTEGAAFINGTGNGQPVGLLTSTDARIKILKTGAAAGFPAANPGDFLMQAFHAVPSVVAQNGAWMMNRTTLGLIREFKDGQGRYLFAPALAEGAASTFLGRPIIEAIDMPDVAAGATPIMFGDFAGYRIVDRVAPTILRDPYTLAGTGQVRFIGRKRVGADVTHPDRFLKIVLGG